MVTIKARTLDLSATEHNIATHLGVAVALAWDHLPESMQVTLLHQASMFAGGVGGAAGRKQIEEFVQAQKDVD